MEGAGGGGDLLVARRITELLAWAERLVGDAGAGAGDTIIQRAVVCCAFWSSVVLSSGVYLGQPMRVHLPLPVEARHFDRWLELFEQTARHLFSEQIAQYFMERARRIAMSLELGVASSQGVLLGKGERFERSG